MDDKKQNLLTIAFLIVVVILGFFFFRYILFNDFSKEDKHPTSEAVKNTEPALTLKADKQAQAEIAEKKAEAEKDKKDKKDSNKKDDKKKEEKASTKQLKQDAENHALKTLEIQSKPKDEFEKQSTQSLFKNVATDKYVKAHQKNSNKDDKNVKYKNVSLEVNDKDLEKSTVKGTLKFDRLTNPKSKDSKVKPTTEVDSKVSIIFKKTDNTLKVDSTQS